MPSQLHLGSSLSAACSMRTLAGSALLLLGLGRRSLPGFLLGAAGAYLIAQDLSSARRRPSSALMSGPSFPNETEAPPITQYPEDEVDEASMESFPASDAPSHGGATRA